MIRGGGRLFSTTSRQLDVTLAACSARFPPNAEHVHQATSLKHLHFRGLTPYEAAGQLQNEIVENHLDYKVKNNNSRLIAPIYPALLTFEMESVYTGGKRERKSSKATKIPTMENASQDKEGIRMTKIGVPYVQTDRGGQVTYHGPGQLVGYFIWDLRLWKNLTSKCFVNFVEQVSLATIQNSGVASACTTSNTGVWVKKSTDGDEIIDTPQGVEKISSIGLNLRRNVTSHGLSINLNPELKYLNNPEFIMCGLNGYHQTSIFEETGDSSLNVEKLSILLQNSITKRMNNYMMNEVGKNDFLLKVETHVFDGIPEEKSEILKILKLS